MRRLIGPLFFGILGVAALVALGLWQVARLGEKEAMLDAIAARIAAPPGALPARPEPERDRYRPVRLQGRFEAGGILVLSSHPLRGPGARLVGAYLTDGGRRVLVDRGYLPDADRPRPRGPAAAAITGHLLWPRDSGAQTPPPDARTGLWFARDPAAMAKALGTEPLLVVLAATDEPAPPALPMPVDPAAIPNNHRQYAATWFLLAAVWAGMTLGLVWRIRRQTL